MSSYCMGWFGCLELLSLGNSLGFDCLVCIKLYISIIYINTMAEAFAPSYILKRKKKFNPGISDFMLKSLQLRQNFEVKRTVEGYIFILQQVLVIKVFRCTSEKLIRSFNHTSFLNVFGPSVLKQNPTIHLVAQKG